MEMADTRWQPSFIEMGSDDTESFREQLVPGACSVHVDAFYMDTHAVTNIEYQHGACS